MEATCQRCHETLREADRYCPACGLPQLVYLESDTVTEFAGAAAENAGAALPGTGEIAWRQALQMAALVAVPAAVVCSARNGLGGIWVMLAAVWVVRLYVRRAAPSRMTAGAGARIGLVMGLLTCWLVLGISCAEVWVQRYLLHQGAQIDAGAEQTLQIAIQMNQQFFGQLGMSSGELAGAMQNLKNFYLSPEGRAGYFLSTILFGLVFLVFFAMLGGALGARLTPRLRRPES